MKIKNFDKIPISYVRQNFAMLKPKKMFTPCIELSRIFNKHVHRDQESGHKKMQTLYPLHD